MPEEVPDVPKSFCMPGDHDGYMAMAGAGCPGLHACHDKSPALTFKGMDLTETLPDEVAEPTKNKTEV